MGLDYRAEYVLLLHLNSHLYFPAMQSVHEGEASAEYVPALQSVQVLSEVAPVAELYFPASHNVQVEEEVAAVAELLERAWD